MEAEVSFGAWVARRRKGFDLTRAQLAESVGYSLSALHKIERDERRPSQQLAELLADCLHIPDDQRPTFLQVARGHLRVERLAAITPQTMAGIEPGHDLSQPARRLPTPPTSLIGREAELATLARLLRDPQCRLLTLVGPGGIGKTRLALEAACLQWEHFADGVFLASLAATSSSEFLVPTIAQAVGLNFAGPTDPRHQLLTYLSHKQVLLLLDNLEHLLDGVDLVVEMLETAPGVKLLATSRERLELHGEWVFEVQGLPVPAEDEVEGLENYSSIQLFLQRAQQVQVGFELAVEECPEVARICRLVEGMPLAIELAAAWVPVLSCAEIADEIERGLDILTTQLRDVPERQRSLNAVFDHTWNLLSDTERPALSGLSVFRGGFTRDAAEQVTGASLPLLSALVTKSLVRRTETGRYDVHELIRQYTASKLAEDPHELHSVQERHSVFYLGLLEEKGLKLQSNRQKEAVAELTGDMDNIRAAWDWSIAAQRFIPLYRVSATLMYLFELRNWYKEGEVTFEKTASALRATLSGTETDALHQVALYALLAHYGFFLLRLGRGEEAYAVLSPSVAFLRTSDEPLATIYSLLYLGIDCWILGRFSEAKESLQESLTLARTYGERWHEAMNRELLGRLAIDQGEHNQARQYLSEALVILRQLGDPNETAQTLSHLGRTMQSLGEYRQAEKLLCENLEMARELGYQFAIGLALVGLGQVVYAQERYKDARAFFSESAELFRELGDTHRLSRTLNHQGFNSLALNDTADAQNAFQTALRMAYEGGFMPSALNALTGLAALGTRQEPSQGTLELVLYILQHPSSSQETKDLAARLRAELEARLTKEEIEAARERAKSRGLDKLVTELLNGW